MHNLIHLINRVSSAFTYPSPKVLNPCQLSNITNLEVEYTKLFVNSFYQTPISLNLSFYTEREPSKILSELSNIYQSLNLQIDSSVKERADHLTILLEFFGILIEDSTPKDFIALFYNNYLRYFKKIPELVKQRSKDSFYIEAADILDQFFKEVEERL